MSTDEKISRREFLEKGGMVVGAVAAMPAVAPGVVAAAQAAMPQRTLGRTGVKVSILAMGCGSRFLQYPADQATAVLEKVVALGINYLDTAQDYGNGESETRVGRFLATRRKDVFLATKMPTTLAHARRGPPRGRGQPEAAADGPRRPAPHARSRRRGRPREDRGRRRRHQGALRARAIRRSPAFIGMTSHTDGAVMARAIERNDLDCVQMAMNPTRALRFEELALPAANKKNLGVIQMKVMGQDKLVGDGKGDPTALLRYAWSLPITTTVCGMPKLEMLEANVADRARLRVAALAGRDGPAAPAVRRPHAASWSASSRTTSTTAGGWP